MIPCKGSAERAKDGGTLKTAGKLRVGPQTGSSIVETTVALFILAFCLLTVLNLLDAGLSIDRMADRQRIGILVARQELGRLRYWASRPSNFFGGDWASQNTTFDSDSFPGYQVTVTITNQTLCSPCTQLEQAYVGPPDTRRLMTSTYRQAVVNASWDPGHASSTVEVVSLIAAPYFAVNAVAIDYGGGSLVIPKDGILNATAVALDNDGNPIPDIFLRWSQSPSSSVGSVGSFVTGGPRTGLSVSFQNFYCTSNGNPVYGPWPGNDTLTAAARSSHSTATSNLTVQLVP